MPESRVQNLDTYEQFIQSFYTKSGLDLTRYKQNQMKRRITNFVTSHNYTNFTDFNAALALNKKLYDDFFTHLTINVSQFFRDPNLWQKLKTDVLPILTQNKTRLKFWSAGCSNGQEPYTLAILMSEYFPKIQFSILATDIDKTVLANAREGFYRKLELETTPPEIIRKYFTQLNESDYQIKDEIKRMITFKEHNLLKDNFETGFDMIACRNVVIYFTEEAKDVLYQNFVNSLLPKGILFTGNTEHLFKTCELDMKSVSTFFYQKQ